MREIALLATLATFSRYYTVPSHQIRDACCVLNIGRQIVSGPCSMIVASKLFPRNHTTFQMGFTHNCTLVFCH